MRRPVTALLAGLALAGALGACGSDEEFTDVVPQTTPELRAPANASLPAAEGDETSTTDTTETTTTETTPDATATPAEPTTPAAPEQTAPAAPQTGGAEAGGETPQGTGGTGGETQQGGADAGEDSGGFSDFCEQNPGACPGQ
jgi:hypothetical protein